MSALPPTPMPTPVVLLASRDEVFARSLESVLAPAGYSVLRAYTARSARDQARRTRPDAVVLATDLEDPTGLELCRQLRADGAVSFNNRGREYRTSRSGSARTPSARAPG